MLVYPDVDWRFNSPSWSTMGSGYLVSRETAEWLRGNYLPDPALWKDWRASPLLAPSLEQLPPALILCPEFNPARSDMEAYAQRLIGAGVSTDYWLAKGMVMGFISMGAIIDEGRRALDRIGRALAAAFGNT